MLKLFVQGSTLIVASHRRALFVDAAQQTLTSVAWPGLDPAQLLARPPMALFNNLYSAHLLRLDHPSQSPILFPRGDARSWELSPRGSLLAVRTPVGAWNGKTTLLSAATGAAASRSIASSGVVFFGADERFYYFDEYGDLFVYEPRTARPARKLASQLGSYVGTPSSSGQEILLWQSEAGKADTAVNLATGAVTAWPVHDPSGRQVGDGRLLDVSSDGHWALFDLDGSFSLQDKTRSVSPIEARGARFVPGTGEIATLSHTGGVDLRSTDGELHAQVLLTEEGYVLRGRDFSSDGKLDLRALTCRVGRHFAPAELCYTSL
jgi:hypothetical protein